MRTKEQINEKIEFYTQAAKYWYKQNKDPNRTYSRGYCVHRRNMCLKTIKILEWVLEKGEEL